jgi:hypothetical protein
VKLPAKTKEALLTVATGALVFTSNFVPLKLYLLVERLREDRRINLLPPSMRPVDRTSPSYVFDRDLARQIIAMHARTTPDFNARRREYYRSTFQINRRGVFTYQNLVGYLLNRVVRPYRRS